CTARLVLRTAPAAAWAGRTSTSLRSHKDRPNTTSRLLSKLMRCGTPYARSTTSLNWNIRPTYSPIGELTSSPPAKMKFSRSSGILLHPTSLPGRFGIGDLGEQAYRFADFLVSSGQTLWQVLPLGPTGYGDSPYACYSAFAGNTLLISLERLAADGLLSAGDLAAAPTFTATRVDFGQVHTVKDQLLSLAFERFQSANNPGLKNEYETFCWSHSDWLDDYALFRALREKHGGRLWREWETRLARHEREALMVASEVLRVEVEAHKFCQFIFFKQWSELKSYCNREGLKLVADVPTFGA